MAYLPEIILFWLNTVRFFTKYVSNSFILDYNVSEYSGKKLFIVEADGPIGPRSIFQAYAFFGLGLFLFIFSGFMAFLEFSPYVADTIRTILERFEPPDMNGL